MDFLNIEKVNAIKAYNEGTPQERTFLEKLFGKNHFVKAGNIIERITCIEDVFTELKESYDEFKEKHKNLSPYKYAQELAEKITAAYNEGWWPTYKKEEKRWFPVFDITGSGFVVSLSPSAPTVMRLSALPSFLKLKQNLMQQVSYLLAPCIKIIKCT